MEYERGNDPIFTQFNVIMMSLAVVVPMLMYCFKNPRGKRAYIATDSVPVLGHALNFDTNKLVEFNERMTFKALIRTGESNYEAFVLGTRYLFISSVETAMDAMRQRPNVFRRDRNFMSWAEDLKVTKGAFNAENPHWGRIRRLTSNAFLGNAIQDMMSAVTHKTHMLLVDIAALLKEAKSTNSPSINGRIPFKRYTCNVIFELAFGTSCYDSEYVRSGQIFNDVDQTTLWALKRSVNPLPDWLYKLLNSSFESETSKAIKRLDALVESVLDAFDKSNDDESTGSDKAPQFLASLRKAAAQEAGSRSALTTEEIRAQIWTFILAGTDTTAVLIESAMFILAQEQYQDLQRELQAEIDAVFSKCDNSNETKVLDSIAQLDALPLVAAFILEVGRLYGPARFLFYELCGVRDVKLAGDFVVGTGEKLVINVAGMMMDENVYRHPKTFDPHRCDYARCDLRTVNNLSCMYVRWLPQYTDKDTLAKMKESYMEFGYGPRICPGQRLATLEAISAVASVLRSYNIQLGCSHMDVKFIAAFTVRISQLPLVMQPRFT